MNVDVLSARTISTYPLSIGTSLAFETIKPGRLPAYDTAAVPKDHLKINDYGECWVNLATLHRNIVGAVGAQYAEALKPWDIAEVLTQETDLIVDIIQSHHPTMRVVFYVCGYSGLNRKYPHATMRDDTTPRQKFAKDQLEATLSVFYQSKSDRVKHVKERTDEELETFDIDKWDPMDPKNQDSDRKDLDLVNYLYYKKQLTFNSVLSMKSKIVLLSHYPVDLLSLERHKGCALLESHTGAVKNRGLWYTKLNGCTNPRMPFNALTLQVYGDKQTFARFKQSAAVIKELEALAERYQWNATTTKSRMKLNIGQMNDKYTAAILKEMF
jgi:hypothetical protein